MSKAVDALIDEATERGELRRRLADERERSKALEEALTAARKSLDLMDGVSHARPCPPRWVASKAKGKHPATPALLFTDAHYDEVVRPEEILGLNKYDREIAYQRTDRAFKGAVKVCRDYITGHTYDGFVLLLGGDNLTGDIHEELKETNQATVIESLIYWLEPMLAGIKMLADEFGKVHIESVPGNHPRTTRKPRAKLRAKDNYDWLMAQLIARELKADKRVTVRVTESADALVSIYDTRILLTHGDQFRGGSGISAALSPMLLGEHRKTKKHASAARHGGEDMTYDLMVMGHFHTRYILPRVIVGGCLVGYNEYAFLSNFEFAPPSQELMLIAPERGVIVNAPIWVADRASEGW